MKPIRFQSSLAEAFETFVRLRQTTGRDYEDQAYLLSRFDRFLVEQNLSGPRVTREMTVRYQESLTHLAPSSQYNRFCVVRQVREYLALDDPKSDQPPPNSPHHATRRRNASTPRRRRYHERQPLAWTRRPQHNQPIRGDRHGNETQNGRKT